MSFLLHWVYEDCRTLECAHPGVLPLHVDVLDLVFIVRSDAGPTMVAARLDLPHGVLERASLLDTSQT
jgi:hypothetical protein